MIRRVVSEANRFVRNSQTMLGWLLLAGALSYGFAITNGSLSIDEELSLIFNNPFAWAEQGRWGTWLLKLSFGHLLAVAVLPARARCAHPFRLRAPVVLRVHAGERWPPRELAVADVFRRCLRHHTFERLLPLLQHLQRRNFLRARLLSPVRPFRVDVAVRTGRATALAAAAVFVAMAISTYQSFAIVCAGGF